MRLFGRIVVIVLAAIGGLTVLGWLLIAIALVSARPSQPPLPDKIVLSLNLDAGLVEGYGDSPLERFAQRRAYPLSTVVQAIDRASRDPRVAGLVARLDGGRIGMAQAQELRAAVLAFRKSSKRSVLFSEDLGGFGGGTASVYLASAFQEVWLQPSGGVGLTGFAIESPFVKGTLEMLGVDPQFGARWEYKGAIETFTRDKFSAENKQSLGALVQAWTKQAVSGIASARNLDEAKLRALMDKGPLSAGEAKQAGLVDTLGYRDELDKSLAEGGTSTVDLLAYARGLAPQPEAVNVALIVGAGPVMSGDQGDDPLAEGGMMDEGRIRRAFHQAEKDPSIKAILFRIDSPGGSYTAADAIWREVGVARAAGKPVVVSMGNVAASGGYFAAMAADQVIAEPGTITGSIGVFAGKFVLADLWKKLGVSWDEVHQGANAEIWSANRPFGQQGWDKLNADLDRIYADFTDKAGKARKLDAAAMDKVARGRIWTGDAAREAGLIDEVGGYPEAFAAIRKLARLPSQMPLNLVTFPRQRPPLEYLMQMAERGDFVAALQAVVAVETEIGALLRPFAGMVARGDNSLRMPPLEAE